MPVAPPTPIAGLSVTAPTGPSAAPAPTGFGAALIAASRSIDPASAPTVSLGAMVQAFAGSPSAAAFAAPALDGAGTAAPLSAPTAAAPAGGAASGNAVIAAAERYLGVPYVWGGTDPAKGLDCSGFVQRVYADLGVELPRVSVDQSKAGTAVASLDQARPGDLVFWRGDGSRPNHIGIYAGDGRMLVAPRTGDVVKYQDITRTPHAIRRVG